MKNIGLLVVDMQEALVKEKPYNDEITINNIKLLINKCRENNVEVIYVRHDGGKGDELEYGAEGWQIHSKIAPVEGEKIVEKRFNSSFRNTDLREYLIERNIATIILVGMQTEYCFDATCKVGFEYGYNLIIPEGANTTFDNEYMSGKEIYDYYNFKIWKNRFAKLEKVQEVIENYIKQ